MGETVAIVVTVLIWLISHKERNTASDTRAPELAYGKERKTERKHHWKTFRKTEEEFLNWKKGMENGETWRVGKRRQGIWEEQV